ncbi:MAG: hypothetical protein DRP71_00185 [Verrucomicrobia bacterium]|nr:MAG: hypothetical protein DRP71_00185 [Verrucomicrobiota bacterium]
MQFQKFNRLKPPGLPFRKVRPGRVGSLARRWAVGSLKFRATAPLSGYADEAEGGFRSIDRWTFETAGRGRPALPEYTKVAVHQGGYGENVIRHPKGLRSV